MMQTALQSSAGDMDLVNRMRKAELELRDILFVFEGPEAKASWEEIPPIDMPMNRRLNSILYTAWGSTHGITGTMRDGYEILTEEFPPVLERIKASDAEIKALQDEMNDKGIQWTPDRVPEWK